MLRYSVRFSDSFRHLRLTSERKTRTELRRSCAWLIVAYFSRWEIIPKDEFLAYFTVHDRFFSLPQWSVIRHTKSFHRLSRIERRTSSFYLHHCITSISAKELNWQMVVDHRQRLPFHEFDCPVSVHHHRRRWMDTGKKSTCPRKIFANWEKLYKRYLLAHGQRCEVIGSNASPVRTCSRARIITTDSRHPCTPMNILFEMVYGTIMMVRKYTICARRREKSVIIRQSSDHRWRYFPTRSISSRPWPATLQSTMADVHNRWWTLVWSKTGKEKETMSRRKRIRLEFDERKCKPGNARIFCRSQNHRPARSNA